MSTGVVASKVLKYLVRNQKFYFNSFRFTEKKKSDISSESIHIPNTQFPLFLATYVSVYICHNDCYIIVNHY